MIGLECKTFFSVMLLLITCMPKTMCTHMHRTCFVALSSLTGLCKGLKFGLSIDYVLVGVSGTVVKRKKGGKLLADLVRPGDKVLVARGGRGGVRQGVLVIAISNRFYFCQQNENY